MRNSDRHCERRVSRRVRPAGTIEIRRCPACSLAPLVNDGDGDYCPNCLYTRGPRITLEDAVARAEAVAVAESRALRDQLKRGGGVQAPRRRAA